MVMPAVLSACLLERNMGCVASAAPDLPRYMPNKMALKSTLMLSAEGWE